MLSLPPKPLFNQGDRVKLFAEKSPLDWTGVYEWEVVGWECHVDSPLIGYLLRRDDGLALTVLGHWIRRIDEKEKDMVTKEPKFNLGDEVLFKKAGYFQDLPRRVRARRNEDGACWIYTLDAGQNAVTVDAEEKDIELADVSERRTRSAKDSERWEARYTREGYHDDDEVDPELKENDPENFVAQYARRTTPVSAIRFDGTKEGAWRIYEFLNGNAVIVAPENDLYQFIVIVRDRPSHAALPYSNAMGRQAYGGQWVVKDEKQSVLVLPDKVFRAQYGKVDQIAQLGPVS